MQTIETQFRQYHVTKVGARHIGEPHDHKSGGLEPLGPIGVYAYANKYLPKSKAPRQLQSPGDVRWPVACAVP